ncbi:hypothetical protein [Nitrospirillum pindoramense]|uniref:Phasin protein n=1 Tax=Nitrospirillum amazonense TaxID=28077 RepID=A0A560GZV8_9PROT|nr:hypothetical protein [Nitrospirillum amazonense]TWB39576.1 hypothetical protein FBZ90_11040 [Nitrospirillum amazonense]
MPDAAKTPFPPMDWATNAPLGTLLSENAAWMDDIHHVYGRVTHGSLAFFQELARFWEQRMHEDREACAEFLTCRTPQDLQTVGQRFALKASQDYAEGISRLLQVSIGALGDVPASKGTADGGAVASAGRPRRVA